MGRMNCGPHMHAFLPWLTSSASALFTAGRPDIRLRNSMIFGTRAGPMPSLLHKLRKDDEIRVTPQLGQPDRDFMQMQAKGSISMHGRRTPVPVPGRATAADLLGKGAGQQGVDGSTATVECAPVTIVATWSGDGGRGVDGVEEGSRLHRHRCPPVVHEARPRLTDSPCAARHRRRCRRP